MDPWNIEERKQQVLHGHELVALLARPLKRFVEAKFQFTTQHSSFLSGLFHRAQQRMLLLLRNIHHLRNLGFGNLETVHPANAFPLGMYF